MDRLLLLRAVLAGLFAIVAAVLAVWLYRQGVSEHPFGPVLPNKTPTYVEQYSGPWIVGSAGALLLAGLLAVAASTDVRRMLAARRTPPVAVVAGWGEL
jgi:hypothetical protein